MRLSGSHRDWARRRRVSAVVCVVGRGEKRAAAAAAELVMDHTIDEVVDPKSPVCGGVQDPYGEDRATEDQVVTPWSVTVARSSIFLGIWFLVD